MPEKKEFIIGVWKFSHSFIFMRPVFRFFKQRKLYFSYASEVCFKAILTVAHLLNSCYSSDVLTWRIPYKNTIFYNIKLACEIERYVLCIWILIKTVFLNFQISKFYYITMYILYISQNLTVLLLQILVV